ncbi:SDR family NAD(P)-dependent oxidoreductase [Saccharopolyspora hirsuta]|uniref:SDR family NAD(P)-dependent oxidoreductase n=1 Tax=Saccharopolyspora hirsuta TaxID=1837 RepID=UPI0033227F85
MLGCRSADRDAAAAAAIREDVPGAAVAVLEVDVADLSSVRNAVRTLGGQPLGALVCNAGVQITRGAQRSHRWVRATFATNHLGHFALIRALLGQLVEPARIALVSSGTHPGPLRSFGFPAPRWEDPRALADPALSSLGGGSGRDGPVRYSTSKLANIYTAYELARRVRDRRIAINAFDPGLMPEIGLARDYPAAIRRLHARIGPLLVRAVPGIRSVDQAAAALTSLITTPSSAGSVAGTSRAAS